MSDAALAALTARVDDIAAALQRLRPALIDAQRGWLTVSEVSRIYRVAPWQIRADMNDGKLAYQQRGARRMISARLAECIFGERSTGVAWHRHEARRKAHVHKSTAQNKEGAQ